MRQSIPYLNIEKSRVFKVDVREVIDAYSKFDFESEFQNLSSGGAISYVEIPNLENNVEAVENLIYYMKTDQKGLLQWIAILKKLIKLCLI